MACAFPVAVRLIKLLLTTIDCLLYFTLLCDMALTKQIHFVLYLYCICRHSVIVTVTPTPLEDS